MKRRAAISATTGLEGKTDRELVEACLTNDSGAWECLIVRYERLIYSIPIRLGVSPEEAGDIFQCVCLILFKKLATLRNHERISSWLITTTRRECWRVGALKQRDAISASMDDLTGLDRANIHSAERVAYERRVAEEQKEIVREAILALPEKCRELLIMLFYLGEEPTYKEISEQLEMPESSIGPTRARCLEKLKKLLRRKL